MHPLTLVVTGVILAMTFLFRSPNFLANLHKDTRLFFFFFSFIVFGFERSTCNAGIHILNIMTT
jgi:hypothetical protein